MNELEPVWHGAHWRTFPPPPIGVPDDPVRPLTHVVRACDRVTQVLEAVDEEEWRTIRGIARACGLAMDSTSKYLAELYATGRIARKRQIRERSGRALLYRRVGRA